MIVGNFVAVLDNGCVLFGSPAQIEECLRVSRRKRTETDVDSLIRSTVNRSHSLLQSFALSVSYFPGQSILVEISEIKPVLDTDSQRSRIDKFTFYILVNLLDFSKSRMRLAVCLNQAVAVE